MQADPKVKLARSVLPVLDEFAYFDTASVGPVSQIYADALGRCTREDLRTGRARAFRFEKIEQARERIRSEIAGVINAGPDELELTRGTTAAIRTLLQRFPWKPGDEVVSTQLEFPPCRDALDELVRNGQVRLRIAEVPKSDAEDLEWLERTLTQRTRLIVFSGVAYTTGQRLPIEPVVELAKTRGIRTLVDGAQLVGAAELDLGRTAIDFLALPLQKWLGGPEGLGALFVRAGSIDWLRSEQVTHGWPVLEAAAEQLEWQRENLGWDWIRRRTGELSRYARAALTDLDSARLVTPEAHAGLVAIRCDRRTFERITHRLEAARIVARLRPELDLLRISTACFTTEREIDRFVAAAA